MRPARTSPDNFPLEELLDDIHRGLIALPDFQRDFDWGEKDVQALLVTVLTGWPIGSLLLMDGRPDYLELRGIEGGPAIPPRGDLTHVILDGQQRMTSLYQALYNSGTHVYAIHLPSLGDGSVDELEESVRYFKRSTWSRQYEAIESQWRDQLLPVYNLRNASEFYEWRDEVLRTIGENDADGVREQLTALYKHVLSGLHRYQVPAVSLSRRIPPRAVARIFERVNRTGMPLDAFDLVVARSFTASWNLRQEYEKAREKYPAIEHYLGDGGLPILQSIALRDRYNVRESAVIDLPGDVVRERWVSAVEGMDAALQFVREFGSAPSSQFIPYRGLIVVLSAIAQDSSLDSSRAQLESWYWGTAFTQSYDVASNTRSVADYRILRGEQGDDHLNYRRRAVVRDALRTATRQSSGAIWRGFVCALLRQPARSLEPGRGHVLFDPSAAPGEVDIHTASLWPRSLATEAPAEPPHLRAMGVVVGRSAAVRRLGGGTLIESLASRAATDRPSEPSLDSQLLPATASYDYSMSSWEDLVDLRVSLLEVFLSDVTDATFVEYEPTES